MFTMRHALVVSALAVFSGLAGCESNPPRVQSTFGPYIPFDGFGTTYDWTRTPQPPPSDPRLANPELQELIKGDVEHELNAKGYRKDAAGSPSFWVAYAIGARSRIERASQTTEAYDEATIIVEIVDAKSGQRMWQGTAQAVVDPAAPPDKRRERIASVAQEMFAKFPGPKAK
jgi:uncharacterized protein DUF4136